MKTRDTSKQRIMYKAIRSWKGSGISIRDYCKLHGYSYESFQYWRKKFKRQDSKEGFVPIAISNETNDIPAKDSVPEIITITRPGGIRVECPITVDLNVLQTLVNL